MKYLKSMFFTILLSIVSVTGYAQTPDEVTLTVSSDGLTKEEATKNALRSAIEQAYGTFVSANTTILNDELVKDEIVTIANGNIKSYEEISSTAMPDGSQFVTLKATVSVSKLISYAQSKGAETEFAGATFGMNLRLQEMNKENEKKVLDNLMAQIKAMLPYSFDRTLTVENPQIVSYCDTLLSVGFTINNTPNENFQSLKELVNNTFKSISLSADEQKLYHDMNMKMYGVGRYRHGSTYGALFTLRNPCKNWFNALRKILFQAHWQFQIIDNLNQRTYGSVYMDETKIEGLYNPGYIYVSFEGLPCASRLKEDDFYVPELYLLELALTSAEHEPPYVRPNETVSLSIARSGAKVFGDAMFTSGDGSSRIKIEFFIPKSDIAKYNNFRVERSDLKYE